MDLAHAHDRFATKLLVTVWVLVLTIIFAVRCAPHRMPYVMVDELVTKRLGDYLGDRIRAHGYVQAGSIEHAGDEYWFSLYSKGVALRVHYRGTWPDRVHDQSELVARGTLTFDHRGWLLDATDLLMRCSIKYGDDKPRLDTVYK